LAGLRYRPITGDGYRARLGVIEAFSALDDFDLYGVERFLRGISAAEATRYVEAAQAFLSSAAYERFSTNRSRVTW
jgi:hypothetical protein